MRRMMYGKTPLDKNTEVYDWQSPERRSTNKEIADLLRKHGGKTSEQLKAEGKSKQNKAEALR